MFKRLTVLLAVVLIVSPVFAASGINGKFGVELWGGGTLLNPSAFSTDYNAALKTLLPNTDLGTPGFVGMAPTGGIKLEYLVTPNVGIYLRSDFFFTQDELSIVVPSSGSSYTVPTTGDVIAPDGEVAYNHAAFSIGYFGLGAKYYIGLDQASKFFLSAGADAGMFLNYQSFWETEFFKDAADANGVNHSDRYTSTDFTSPFFGANIDLGAKYFITDNAAVDLNLGYRLASMSITYPSTFLLAGATDASGNPLLSAKSIDLSGVYFGAGLSFYFGGSPAVATRAAARTGAATTGALSKYEQYGDYYFKAKNYKYALSYYNSAIKQAPNAGLYKKVGFTYYYLGDKARAAQYLKYYLRLTPSDTAVANWVKALGR
jgi:hypothetical protein